MLKYLRIGVSALALSAFVVAPIMTVATADYAYAKNGNGNGNGGGKGNGGGNGNGGDKGGNGKSADKGNSGKGHDKASKTRNASKGNKAKGNKGKNGKGFAKSVKNDFNSLKRNVQKHGIAGLFKQEQKRTTRAVSAKPTKNAPAASTRPAHRAAFKDKGAMHPSNLGKMNGFLNSSINAKLAHIANGQYAKNLNSPVSLGAAVAVAGYQLRTTQATLAYSDTLNNAQTTLDGLDDQQIQEAQEAVENLTDKQIQDAQKIVDAPNADPESIEYKEAQKTLESKAIADAQTTVDQAIDDGDVDPDTGELTKSFGQEVTDAENALDAAEGALDEAEKNLLGTYKDQDYLAALTPAEQSEFLNDAISEYGALPNDEAIADALAKNEAKETETDVDVDGEDMADEDDLDSETTDQVLVDDAEKAEQG